MKKLTMLLTVFLLAVSASACSESPTAVNMDNDVPLTSAEALNWTKPKTTDPNQVNLPPSMRRLNGYALGME